MILRIELIIFSLEKGIRLGDLFNDHDEIRDLLKRELPTLTPELVNNVLNASIKMQYVSIFYNL